MPELTPPDDVEFSRPLALGVIGPTALQRHLCAREEERAALARRFGLRAITELVADLTVWRDGAHILVTGHVRGQAVQACVISDADVVTQLDEPINLAFQRGGDDDLSELELEAQDMDILPLPASAIDLGEAVAQTFALALDPFVRAAGACLPGHGAGAASDAGAGDAQNREPQKPNPFAVLGSLKV